MHDFKLQVKWGTELLPKFIKKITEVPTKALTVELIEIMDGVTQRNQIKTSQNNAKTKQIA